MSTSDGSTADYYELPAGATELQDLISHRNLNAQDGEIFRAIYRKGRASHSDELRDARKVLFYALAEVKRLEKLAATPTAFGQQNMIDPADVEISEKSDKPGFAELLSDFRRKADAGMQEVIEKAIEPYRQSAEDFLATVPCDEPASQIDDSSERMQAIGQNWKEGDRIEVISKGFDERDIGEMLTVDGLDNDDADQPVGVMGDDKIHSWPIVSRGHFLCIKWHSRPSA